MQRSYRSGVSRNYEVLNLDQSHRPSDIGLARLKGLTKLSELDLLETQVTDAGLVHLKGLTNLSDVDLRGTRVSDAGLVHLKGLVRPDGSSTSAKRRSRTPDWRI